MSDILELPPVNVIVRDGKVFSLTETELPASKLLTEIKEFYEASYRQAKDNIADEQFSQCEQERIKQLAHIDAMLARNKAIIPPALYDKPVMYCKDAVCEARWIRYKPNVITSAANDLVNDTRYMREDRTYTFREGWKKVWEFTRLLPPETRVVINIEQSLVDLPVLFIYNTKRDVIYTPFLRTFHTMSGTNLCTGDFTASQFWNHGSFSTVINQVNGYSLGNDDVNRVTYITLFKDEYVTNITTEQLWNT